MCPFGARTRTHTAFDICVVLFILEFTCVSILVCANCKTKTEFIEGENNSSGRISTSNLPHWKIIIIIVTIKFVSIVDMSLSRCVLASAQMKCTQIGANTYFIDTNHFKAYNRIQFPLSLSPVQSSNDVDSELLKPQGGVAVTDHVHNYCVCSMHSAQM